MFKLGLLVMQRTEQLPTRALIAPPREPELVDVNLCEREVRKEGDDGEEIRGALRARGGVRERCQDAL